MGRFSINSTDVLAEYASLIDTAGEMMSPNIIPAKRITTFFVVFINVGI